MQIRQRVTAFFHVQNLVHKIAMHACGQGDGDARKIAAMLAIKRAEVPIATLKIAMRARSRLSAQDRGKVAVMFAIKRAKVPIATLKIAMRARSRLSAQDRGKVAVKRARSR